MKRFGTGVVIVFGVVILCLTALVAVIQMQPGHVAVEKSITVQATAADLAPLVRDLKGVNRWSPWAELDPDLKQTYSDPSSGLGATYAWAGNNDVGSGQMTVITDEPNRIQHKVAFKEPFESEATATIAWEAKGEDLTIRWGFDTEANFMMKAIGLVMPFDEAVGKDYAKGLAKLKPLVEEAAARRQEAEAAAAEEATAAEEEGDSEEE